VGSFINAHIEIVMLLGEYRQSISSTGSLELPEQLLAGIEGGLVIARGFDQNLLLFPAAEWNELAQALLGRPITDHTVRTLRRRLFSAAKILIPDENGRITLPRALRSFAGINGEVILSGMFNHVELWSSERWQPERALFESEDAGGRWDGIGI
jgi:MraZ protein